MAPHGVHCTTVPKCKYHYLHLGRMTLRPRWATSQLRMHRPEVRSARTSHLPSHRPASGQAAKSTNLAPKSLPVSWEACHPALLAPALARRLRGGDGFPARSHPSACVYSVRSAANSCRGRAANSASLSTHSTSVSAAGSFWEAQGSPLSLPVGWLDFRGAWDGERAG